jgi:hypothetical protein
MTDEGYDTYCTFLAVKQTYNTENDYDYFKYHGKMRVSKETFFKRKDRSSFFRLSRYFKGNSEHIRNFIFMCLYYDKSMNITKCLDSKNKELYVKNVNSFMLDYKNSFSNQFNDYMNHLKNFDIDFVKSMSAKNQSIPDMAAQVYTGNISPFFTSSINKIFSIYDNWKQNENVFKPFMIEPINRLYVFNNICELYDNSENTEFVKNFIKETLDK